MAGFKTRARALDMLGRQQIAGIPTAINELFKNAYDAYADKVEIDYFRKERLFVLRDNGLGMTREEFEIRWLTLGTESKVENKKTKLPPIDKSKPIRPTMGEKGIGRLAIASIGRQVLVLSRAMRDGVFQPTVAAFIHWGVFELPNINLEDIVIPVHEYQDGYLPDSNDISELVVDFIDGLEKMIRKADLDEDDFTTILNELEGFKVDPVELDKILPGFLTLTENGGGTHFYVSPTSEILNSDIDGSGEKDEASKIEKTLIGFTNPMLASHKDFGIQTAFREYDTISGTFKDVINPDEYFSQDDFSICDHFVEGEFDEFGQFKGTVKVYQDEEFQDHLVSWNGNNFRQTECGPFKIKFGYLQGALRQSVVDPENFAILNAKLNKYGGLYIFRDGLRVLPYGNNDYDFILLEKRRNKSASYYFFSYRRLFGAIEVSRKTNPSLKEKAGREGFIENKAYNQFTSILQNFFVQLATDFFRESGGGPRTDVFLKIRAEREALHEQLKRRKKQAKAKKEEFRKSLDSFFEKLELGLYSQELEKIVNSGIQKLSRVSSIPDNEDASREIVNTEKALRSGLKEFKNQYKISTPRGFAPFKDDKYRFEAYLNASTDLDQMVVEKGEKVLETEIAKIISTLGIQISKRKRLEVAVESIANQSMLVAKERQLKAKNILEDSRNQISTIAQQLVISLDNRIKEAQDQFKYLPMESSKDFDLVKERQRLEEMIQSETEKNTRILDLIVDQLETLPKNREQAETMLETGAITITALEEEIDDLQAKIHADVELTQLGLAVSVVNHEFGVTVKSIRDGLRNLQSWADVNSNLESVYKTLRANFDHLDAYLKVFTPLNRRLYRKEESIPLRDIKTFLQELFEARFERHNVKMVVTNRFTSRSILGLRSTFYPVFVNLVDNAIYWLSKKGSDEERVVRLHADDTGFYISNNGPEIPMQDRERIFEFGFSRKPTGRGMGLAISREVLEGAGYQLFVDEPREKSTVTFKIQPKVKN